MIRAAGILYQTTDDGRVLFLQRSGEGDAAGTWCLPGGKVEDGESPEDAAVRESTEEIGSAPDGKRGLVSRTVRPSLPESEVNSVSPEQVDFTTFLQKVPEPFEVTLDGEHTAFTWAPFASPPQPLHPGVEITLRRMASDELGVARMMAAGELTSPQFYENVALFDIRITGTNVAYRSAHEEFVYRDPANYLTDDFLARCNGLPVLWDHPSGSLLTSEEFANRVVGTTFVPYIKGEDVWAIVKIYDDDAKKQMAKGGLSTSPAVNFSTATVFRDAKDQNKKLTDEDGNVVLFEGKPSLLDHIAVCDKGVWDKGGPASGVNTAKADSEMTEDEKKARDDAAAKADAQAKADQARKDSDDERAKRLDAFMDSMSKRMDAYEEEKKADRAKADAAKKDADEETKKANEAADEPGAGDPDKIEKKEKADSKKADSKKADEDEDDDKKKPAFLKDSKKDSKKADEDEDEKEKKDSAKADSERKLADMQREMADLKRRLDSRTISDSDHAVLAQTQARADSVHAMFGSRAPRPLDGETPLAYRRRMAGGFKEHSKAWGGVDLNLLPLEAFNVAESQIFADAEVVARNPTNLHEGELREVPREDPFTGQKRIEFYGQPRDWMNAYSGNKQVLRSFKPRM